jgi:hypothetical protein
MTALSKFLLLVALFLLANHANALSSVAENYVRVIHLIRLQQLMSNPTNEPSCGPSCEPTNRIDLDAELPNNLSSKGVKYRLSQKQDAELPSKITDMQNTQTCGLCHNKKSELESLAEQPIAATDSSQRGLCHSKKSELESLADQLIAASNSSQRGLCHGKKSELESLVEQPIAATNSSQCGLCRSKKYGLDSLAEQPIAASNSSQRPVSKFNLSGSS